MRHAYDPDDAAANELGRARDHVEVWRAIAAAATSSRVERDERAQRFERRVDAMEATILAVYDMHSDKITADGICGACGKHAPCPTLEHVWRRGEWLANRRVRNEEDRRRQAEREAKLLAWAEDRDKKIASGEIEPWEFDVDEVLGTLDTAFPPRRSA